MLGKFPTQTELDIHIGSIHRKIPFSSCSCSGDVQESRLDSCGSCDNNWKMVTVYISTKQSLQVLATYVGRNLRMKLKWTHTHGVDAWKDYLLKWFLEWQAGAEAEVSTPLEIRDLRFEMWD